MSFIEAYRRHPAARFSPSITRFSAAHDYSAAFKSASSAEKHAVQWRWVSLLRVEDGRNEKRSGRSCCGGFAGPMGAFLAAKTILTDDLAAGLATGSSGLELLRNNYGLLNPIERTNEFVGPDGNLRCKRQRKEEALRAPPHSGPLAIRHYGQTSSYRSRILSDKTESATTTNGFMRLGQNLERRCAMRTKGLRMGIKKATMLDPDWSKSGSPGPDLQLVVC